MEIYEEYVVWDHEILVGFYVSADVKAAFDAVCKSEGIRNGQVLAGLMRDYLTMHDSVLQEREEQEAKTLRKNQAEFLELFGGAPGPHGSDGQSHKTVE